MTWQRLCISSWFLPPCATLSPQENLRGIGVYCVMLCCYIKSPSLRGVSFASWGRKTNTTMHWHLQSDLEAPCPSAPREEQNDFSNPIDSVCIGYNRSGACVRLSTHLRCFPSFERKSPLAMNKPIPPIPTYRHPSIAIAFEFRSSGWQTTPGKSPFQQGIPIVQPSSGDCPLGCWELRVQQIRCIEMRWRNRGANSQLQPAGTQNFPPCLDLIYICK